MKERVVELVAKSYQNLELIGEPYTKNGKMYVLVAAKAGSKEVRWYSDAEYAKIYHIPAPADNCDYRKAFDFDENNAILIVVNCGDSTDEHMLDLNRQFKCFMYNEYFGWFVRWNKDIAAELAEKNDVSYSLVYWGEITKNSVLMPIAQVRAICDAKRGNVVSTSEFQYSIGERHTIMLELVKKVELKDHFGTKFKYTFEHDATGNIFEWTTAAVNLNEHQDYEVTGTVKEYKTENNTKITVLTRCKVKE